MSTPRGLSPPGFGCRRVSISGWNSSHVTSTWASKVSSLASYCGSRSRRVTLVAGAKTRVAGLGSNQPGRLIVEVVDADGQSVRNRILRVRDRMYKEWTAPGRIIITSGPVEPIPLPPAVRLAGAPVILEPIRAGWLELIVDDPAGDARYYLRKVEPGTTLRLVVDP